MMDEVFMYNKFGYCKFQDHCKRMHFGEICQKIETCEATKTCHKRHPKICKKNETENGCQFGNECAYQHKTQLSECEANATETKYDILEKVISEMVKR